MALIFYPKANSDGLVTVPAGTTTIQSLTASPIVHENTSFEEGYATLAVKHTIVAGDTVQYYLGLHYNGELDDAADFLLEDKDGVSSFNSESDTIVLFSLNRQNFWTLHEGMTPKVKKTGTNGQLEVKWRVLYR